MRRRQRGDTVQGAVNAMFHVVNGQPAVPDHVSLRPADMPFWSGILRARGFDDWMPADLVVAAQLARCQCDIETQARLLQDEGAVLGTRQRINPRIRLLAQLERREMALMRTLRMGGWVSGDARDDGYMARKQAQAERAHSEPEVERLVS
jgi:hypothetical protein